MSVKIYNGYRFRPLHTTYGTPAFTQLNSSLETFTTSCRVKMRKDVAAALCETLAARLDEALWAKPFDHDWSPSTWYYDARRIVSKQYGLLSPIYTIDPTKVSVTVLPELRSSRFGLLLWTGHKASYAVDMFPRVPGVVEYTYTNQVEKPKDMHHNTWRARKEFWRRTLDDFKALPAEVGYTREIVTPRQVMLYLHSLGINNMELFAEFWPTADRRKAMLAEQLVDVRKHLTAAQQVQVDNGSTAPFVQAMASPGYKADIKAFKKRASVLAKAQCLARLKKHFKEDM